MARLDKQTALFLSEPLEDIYAAVVDRLIINIARHLGTGKAFRTADWEVYKLQEIGQLTDENAKIIAEEVAKVPKRLREALEESQRIALDDLENRIKEAIAEGKLAQAPTDGTLEVLESLLQQAQDRMNLVNATILESSQVAYTQAVTNTVAWTNQALVDAQKKATLDIFNENVMALATGTETRNQVLKKAITQLSENGIYGFVDRAGRHWSPEAYVAMDIRTTVHNTAIQSIRARQQDYNSQIFQVSTHSGARPLCYPYQGKYYSWDDTSGVFKDGNGISHSYKGINSTSYGKAAGLFGINCGHYPIPQIPGVTIPQNRKIEDKEKNDRIYKESQRQRDLERQIRNAKRQQAAFKAAGMEDAAKEASQEVQEMQKKMRDFIDKTGRTRRHDRESITFKDKDIMPPNAY